MPKSATINALAFAVTVLSLNIGCTSCKRDATSKNLNPEHLDGQCLYDTGPQIDIERYLPGGCQQKKDKSLPIIYAHYLDQSFPNGTHLEDILANNRGTLECAPGPFLNDQNQPSENFFQPWQLKENPNYFALHLEGKNTSGESFYLANQGGLPLACQYIQLRKQNDTTLVLMPKVKMQPGQNYFLYLKYNEGDQRRVWIQPISSPGLSSKAVTAGA